MRERENRSALDVELARSRGPSPSVISLCFVRDLFLLTKPRILSLLLVSTAAPMVLAGGGRVSLTLVLWTLLGGALISGSACAMNCIWERDIDALMERTKNRPMPQGRVSPVVAFTFAVIIGVFGLIVLAHFANPLAAGVALFGHLFYVLVYTLWLKRRTAQNIVIGGAAGAVPPVVGWVAVTGVIDLTALLLFLVVFLWTPPHFWALALNKNSDYKKAGVPMMPVIFGERSTHNQMYVYVLLLLPVSALLILSDRLLGWCSFSGLGILGIIFVLKVYQLRSMACVEARTKKAWDVFGFSLLYLAIFFLFLVVDSIVI